MMSESIDFNYDGFEHHELRAAKPHCRDSIFSAPSAPPQDIEYGEERHSSESGEERHSSEYEPPVDILADVHVPLTMQPFLPYTPAADVRLSVTPESTPSLSTRIHTPMKNKEPGDDDEERWMFGSPIDDVYEDATDIKSTKKDVHENLNDSLHEESSSLESNYDPIVEVYVGPKGQKFEIHEHLLCHMSGYFLHHFRSKRPVPVREPELLKANPEFFTIFLNYCYSNQILLPKVPTKARRPAQYLLGAYYLAGKLAAQRFKNAIVDQLSRELVKKDTPPERFAKWAKQLFGKVYTTPLRLLFTNAFYIVHKDHYREFESGAFHVDMKHELLKTALGLAKDRPKPKELKIDAPEYCRNYHEHDHYNPSWICQAGRQVKNPFLNKEPTKSACGNGLLNSFSVKVGKEVQDDKKYEAGLRKPTKKRKTEDGAIDTAFFEDHDNKEKGDNIPF